MLRSIALRLMSGFLVIIVIISAVFGYVGIRIVDDRMVAGAQRRVAESLGASRELEPFVTTKEVGHGTGPGLALSFGIVREHLGASAVESAPGKGTVFTVSLPVGEAGAA